MNDLSSTPEEVRQLAQNHLRRTGMAPADFARRVGYAYTSIHQFMSNRYRRGLGSKEQAICEAILNYVGRSEANGVEQFSGKLYEIGNVRVLRSVFERLCTEECILMVYAPPGSGKTHIARALIPQCSFSGVSAFRVNCRFGITGRDLMRRIAVACGSIGEYGVERTINNLRYDFAGRRVALYFDEAQHLSIECLETVRELNDELHWSLCFAGSHSIDKIFTKWLGDLEQLESRVLDKITLPGVTSEEADGIIRSELPGLSPSKVRTLLEKSYVDVRGAAGGERYLSIRRIFLTVRELQKLMPEAADPQHKQEITLATATQEEVA
jgi:DNA transposition AAA+ family ATPase